MRRAIISRDPNVACADGHRWGSEILHTFTLRAGLVTVAICVACGAVKIRRQASSLDPP